MNDFFDRKAAKWIQSLQSNIAHHKTEAIDEMIEIFFNLKALSHDEIASLQRAFTTACLHYDQKTKSNLIITMLIDMCDKIAPLKIEISVPKPTDSSLETFLRCCDIVETVSKHFIFGIHVLNDENYVKLLNKMLAYFKLVSKIIISGLTTQTLKRN